MIIFWSSIEKRSIKFYTKILVIFLSYKKSVPRWNNYEFVYRVPVPEESLMILKEEFCFSKSYLDFVIGTSVSRAI